MICSTNYYREIFKSEHGSGFTLHDDFFSPKEKITPDQDLALEAPFAELEIEKALFASYLDGTIVALIAYLILFYQHF